MYKHFEFKMERQEGGNPVTLSVTDGAVTLTIDPPVRHNEKEAMDGLKALAEKALKRELLQTEISEGDGIPSLKIKTAYPDLALAAVVATSLEVHGVLKEGEAKNFRMAVENHQQQEATRQQEAMKLSPEFSHIEQLAAIRQAMSGVVTAEKPSTETNGAQTALPGKEKSVERGV